MNTYTNEQLELKAHIAKDNIKALENGSMFTMTDDLEHWANMDVFNINQYEKHCIIGTYIDVYKEIHGIKPRWMNFDNMSFQDISDDLDRMIKSEEEERISIELEEKRIASERKEANKYRPNTPFACLGELLQ